MFELQSEAQLIDLQSREHERAGTADGGQQGDVSRKTGFGYGIIKEPERARAGPPPISGGREADVGCK